MGVVSIGRNLVIRQLLLAVLVGALGMFAYMAIGGAETLAERLVQSGTPEIGASEVLVELQSAQTKIILATVVAMILMIGISIPVMHFRIVRPIQRLANALDRTASGDRASPVEGESRGDEIGVMARALQRIRGELVSIQAHADAIAVPRNETARQEAGPSLSRQVETYSAEMSAYVSRLNSITKRLSEASDRMILAAEHASEGSDQATTASSNAAGDVSSVATASEQLLDSIEEISRQVVQSTSVVKEAVERAVETNAGMGRLSTAAQKVGDVVSLISRIAAQTNLLALNATIEAARAGEAGRGFAVVAQEVKTLATQTAKATQDITGQIAEMQDATEQSVVAIDKIQKKISEVEHISTIIAAAVHEQGAATQEIARNVRSAAAGTASMSGHVDAVVKSVGETSANAASVAALAKEFDELTGTMSKMVHRASKFAETIRAA